jgi:hypothetical protein
VRLGLIPEGPLEWLALRANRVPTPLAETQLAVAWARTLMAATRAGVFEALADGPATAAQVASACGLAGVPARRLLDALTGMGTLLPAGDERYRLGRAARRWLLRASTHAVVEKMLFSYDEWRFVEHYDRYLLTAEPLDMHAMLVSGRAFDPIRRGSSPTATPTGATSAGCMRWRGSRASRGGARAAGAARCARCSTWAARHGRFAAALLRRHPRLRATVLDLPRPSPPRPGCSPPRGSATACAPGRRRPHDDLGEGDVGRGPGLAVHASPRRRQQPGLARAGGARAAPGGLYVVQDLVRPRRRGGAADAARRAARPLLRGHQRRRHLHRAADAGLVRGRRLEPRRRAGCGRCRAWRRFGRSASLIRQAAGMTRPRRAPRARCHRRGDAGVRVSLVRRGPTRLGLGRDVVRGLGPRAGRTPRRAAARVRALAPTMSNVRPIAAAWSWSWRGPARRRGRRVRRA